MQTNAIASLCVVLLPRRLVAQRTRTHSIPLVHKIATSDLAHT